MKNTRTILNICILISSSAVGIVAVLYAKLIDRLQKLFFTNFHASPILTSCLTPFLFVLAAWLVKKYAPDAKGSGIPQVMTAVDDSFKYGNQERYSWKNPLISIKTVSIKIISSCIAILGGASIGREGPTVQISAALFVWIGNKFRKYHPRIEFQGLIVAGASAGLAAAFNTPIAGIAFAIEELIGESFTTVRKYLMVSIIISGVVAQGIQGYYVYFGRPIIIDVPVFLVLKEAISLGIIGGLIGGLFVKILTQSKVSILPKNWFLRAFIAGIVIAVIGYFSHGDTSGSGYDVIKDVIDQEKKGNLSLFFPIYKMFTTSFSYVSGIAGGLLSPSLSIGAGLGLSFSSLFGLINFQTCALLGMAAFFSGSVGAPLTAVVILMEMTNEYSLVLPLMITSYLAFSVGKIFMPVSLYRLLSKKHLEN